MPDGRRQAPGASTSLKGIWAAIFTPFDAAGALDLAGAAENARAYRERFGLSGIFCNGIMGEGWSLCLSERMAALEAVLDGANGGDAGRLDVGVVVTHHALAETLELARHAGRVGAHHVVLMRPRGPWSAAELAAIGGAVADASGLPLVLFESTVPGMTFGPAAMAELAASTDIIGVKATGGVKAVADLRRRFPELTICDPHEDQHLSDLLMGDDAPLYADPEPYLYALANGNCVSAYNTAVRAGDLAAAAASWRALAPFRAVYDKWIIGPLDQGQSPVAALKLWAGRRGLIAGQPRFPILPLNAETGQTLAAEIEAADALVARDWPKSP